MGVIRNGGSVVLGALWNADYKLKRESESSTNFIYKLFVNQLVSKSGFICLQRQWLLSNLSNLSYYHQVSEEKNLNSKGCEMLT